MSARRRPAPATERPAAVRGAAEPPAARELVPAWLPPLVYALATVLLCREFFFQGGRLLGTDTYALSYFARSFYTSFVNAMQRFPLWNPLIFGGMPFVDGMHGDIFYPPSLALFFLDPGTFWGWKMAAHLFLAGLFAQLWLRALGLDRAAAFFGGLVYMLGADLVTLVYPGGDGKLFVSALAPLVFWLAERCVQRRRLADFALFGLGIALIVFTSHMQLAYFTVWGVSLYFLFRLARLWRSERRAGAVAGLFGLFVLAGVAGVAAAAVQVVPPLGYLREWSQRAGKTVQAGAESGYAYSTTWSLHPEEAVSLIVPEFVGDNAPTEVRSGNTYWGRNPFKLNHEYAGLVPLLLLPLLLSRRRRPETWFFAGLAGLSLLYALGATTPAFRLFYRIPGVSLFRAPSLIIFLYGLSVATLGALGVQQLMERSAGAGRDGPPGVRAPWVVAAGFLLLALAESAGLLTNAWQSVVALPPDRAAALAENLSEIRTGFWIAFALAVAVAGICEAATRGWIRARDAVLLLVLLAALDLYRVGRPFVRSTVLMGQAQVSRDPSIFAPDETIEFLQGAAAGGEIFRVYDLGLLPGLGAGPAYGSNVLASHGIEQLTGHHGNEIGRYRELMGGSDGAPNVAVSRLRLLDLANVGYVVSPVRLEIPGYEEAFVGTRSAVYRNLSVLPRAYLVGRAETVPDAQAVERLLAEDFDAARTVLLADALPAGFAPGPDPVGGVDWQSREADRLTLRVRTDRPALLVISDNYYPAWKATVDGEPVPVVRANYAFRAVPVPAGDHEVAMVYESRTLRASASVSVGLLVLLIGLSATGLRRGRGEPART